MSQNSPDRFAIAAKMVLIVCRRNEASGGTILFLVFFT
jgi:hypothetical protein